MSVLARTRHRLKESQKKVDLNLRNRFAVIVGGASGIGLASARSFASEGAHIALWDSAETAAIAKSLEEEFAIRALGISVDVTQAASVTAACESTLAQFGMIDHLVHSAAVGSGKFGFPFTNLGPNDWSHVFAVNMMGMVHVAHAIGPHMRERKCGSMIFLSSVAGQIGSQTDPPYSASKAANINFAQCIAKD